MWCMVHGAWCMVHGAWCMVHGAGDARGSRGCRVHGAGDAGDAWDAATREKGVAARSQGACSTNGSGIPNLNGHGPVIVVPCLSVNFCRRELFSASIRRASLRTTLGPLLARDCRRVEFSAISLFTSRRNETSRPCRKGAV